MTEIWGSPTDVLGWMSFWCVTHVDLVMQEIPAG